MKSFLKIVGFFCVMFFLAQNGYSQEDTYKIELKDFHSTTITDVFLTKDKKYIITSDSDGKVLQFNANNLEYHKTIKPYGSIPIQGIQTLKKDSVVLLSQRYDFSFKPEQDSLVLYNLYFDKEPFKNEASFKIIPLDSQDYFGLILSKDNSHSLGIVDDNFNTIHSVSIPEFIAPKSFVTSYDFSQIAYISEIGTPKKINVLDTKTGEILRTIQPKEGQDVVSMFFDKNSNELFAITGDYFNSKTEIYSLKDNTIENPIYTINYPSSPYEKVTIKSDSNNLIFAFSTSFPMKPLVIIKNKNQFSHQVVDIPKGVNKAEINPETKEIIYVNKSDFNNIHGSTIYNYQTQKLKGTYPELTSDFYQTLFLPDNSWIAYRETYGKDILNSGIKYYEKGTFNNRFGMLSFKDYLDVKHQIHSYGAYLIQNKGITLVTGNSKTSDEDFSYYIYDFPKDAIKKVTNIKLLKTAFQDYNNLKNILLLSNEYYYNKGHTESIQLELVIDDKIIPIDGDYKFGKISESGNHLLTISKENQIKIQILPELKTVFTKDVPEGSFYVNSVDSDSFVVSNSYRVRSQDKCSDFTYVIEYKDNTFTTNEMSCILISDVASTNNTTGFIIENFGIGINNKTLAFSKSEFPTRISFDKDASKFMLSLTNGKNVVYDSHSLEPLVYVIHPNPKSHILWDVNSNYFSNINPQQFLQATINGKKIPLNQVEKYFFKPEVILQNFSEPNQNYMEALTKALNIRKEYTNVDSVIEYQNIEKSNPINKNSNEKPNLYLLSVGVSDYQDKAYQLTLPDKDAIDIAKLYGNLSAKEIKNYNNKYFGTKYILHNQDTESLGTLNNYSGIYNSYGKKHLLNLEGTIWLEEMHENFTIWNFDNKTKKIIQLPEIEQNLFFNELKENIFIKPDNTGFYLKIGRA